MGAYVPYDLHNVPQWERLASPTQLPGTTSQHWFAFDMRRGSQCHPVAYYM